MSAPLFTPGPWRVENDGAIVSQGRSLAAVWPTSLLGGGLPQEANANLIANAPELYAAVERAIAIIEDAERDTNWCSGDPYSDDGPVKDFRALLAKARGEQA